MIFFDIDGTLLDDAHAVACGLDSLFAKHRDALGLSRQELTLAWHRLFSAHYSRYLLGELSMAEQRRMRVRGLFCADDNVVRSDRRADAVFAQYLIEYKAGWRLFDDVLPTLQALRHRRLGVITNGEGTQQIEKLVRTGLRDLFSVVVTAEDCGVGKPDRRIFVEACSRAGVPVAASTYVGDNWKADALGSLESGLRPIWLRRKGESPEPLRGVRMIHSLSELPSLLALESDDTSLEGISQFASDRGTSA